MKQNNVNHKIQDITVMLEDTNRFCVKTRYKKLRLNKVRKSFHNT